jgi:endonuclease YncB( thermonuclease family)
MVRALVLAMLALGMVGHTMPVSADTVARGDINVVEADTIEIQGKRIRLIDLDAPELGCGFRRSRPGIPR